MSNVETDLWGILNTVEQTPGRKDKLKLLSDFVQYDSLTSKASEAKSLLQEVVLYACNPVWTYGVINTGVIQQKDFKYDWSDFSKLLTQLRDRKLTGNDAKAAVSKLLKKSWAYKWYQRVLSRDLNIGVGVDTFLKLFPGLFPVMKPMLCQKYQGGDLLTYWYVQPKLDGLRCVIIVDENKNMVALSRNNKPLNNVDHIFAELRKKKQKGYVLDGELFGTNWNKSLSILSTDQKHKDAKNIKFFVFDTVHLFAWRKLGSVVKLKDRVPRLRKLVKGCKYIKALTYTHTAQTQEEIRHQFEGFLQQGYEGVVLKDPESLYDFKRSNSWLKAKPVLEDDFEIVGIAKGDVGGKFENTTGSVIVQGTTTVGKKTFRIYTHVGTGMSDKLRDKIWKEWKTKRSVKGLTVQIEFQEVALTTDPQKVYALRFPVFKRIRTDK